MRLRDLAAPPGFDSAAEIRRVGLWLLATCAAFFLFFIFLFFLFLDIVFWLFQALDGDSVFLGVVPKSRMNRLLRQK